MRLILAPITRSASRLVSVLLLLVGRVALANGVASEPMGGNGWDFPKDVSLHGWRIDSLIQITLVFVTILFVIMCIWMLVACLKHGKNHTAEYDRGDARKQTTFALALSGLIFFVVDGNLFINSTIDTHVAFWNFADAEKHPNVVKIEVNARQWAWDFRYAGPDGKFGTADDILTLNDMRVPVDAPVIVQMSAVDVIHSFYLPHLRVKTDAVPGTINAFWFQATETGTFEIACAQHCGMAHYKMAGLLRVLSQQDYEQWAIAASANSLALYDSDDEGAHWGWEWQEL